MLEKKEKIEIKILFNNLIISESTIYMFIKEYVLWIVKEEELIYAS